MKTKMRLHQTRFWSEYYRYEKIINDSSMRCTVDAYVYFKILKKYDYKDILEIGFFEGQTAGLMAEITGDDAIITCLDPNPRCELFDSIYADLQHKVKLHQTISQDYKFSNYDFIIIDGEKKFDFVSVDIQNSIRSIRDGGMILINEFQIDDVHNAIEKHMLPQGFVPFLETNQTLFFHRIDVDRVDLLDYELPELANNFIRFQNKDKWGHTVLEATSLPIFTDRLDFFDKAIREFNI